MKSIVLLCHAAFSLLVCSFPFILGDVPLPATFYLEDLSESPSHISDNHSSEANETEIDDSMEQSYLYSKPTIRNKRSYKKFINLLRENLGRKVLQAYKQNALINNRMTRGMMYPSNSYSQRFVGTRGKRTASNTEKAEEKEKKQNQDGPFSETDQEQENNIRKLQDLEMFPDSYDLIDDRNQRSARNDIRLSERGGDTRSYDRPGLTFFGSRGKKDESFDMNEDPNVFDYIEEEDPFVFPEMAKKDISSTFWGARGKKIVNDFKSPNQATGLNYMFFGARGKKDDSLDSKEEDLIPSTENQYESDDECCKEEKQKRQNPGQGFWGARGKKEDIFINPLGPNADSRKAFWGVRGKRYNSGQEFWGARGKRYSPGQEFWGARGKKYNPSQEFWGIRGKKYDPGQGFWGVRGKKYEPSQEFWGVRGKKYDSGEGFWGVRGKKYNPGQEFWGIRGKKYEPGQGFWGARGKKADLGNSFWGVRGKKLSGSALYPFSDIKENNQERLEKSKKADPGKAFWGVRGKKPSNIPKGAFWGARGKKDDGITQSTFWGTRGKRNIAINSETGRMSQSSPNNLIRKTRGMKPFRRMYPKYKFWEIKGKKIDPSRVFFGVRGKR